MFSLAKIMVFSEKNVNFPVNSKGVVQKRSLITTGRISRVALRKNSDFKVLIMARTIKANFSFYLQWFLLDQVLALCTKQITANDPITIFDFSNRSIDFYLFSTYCLGSFIQYIRKIFRDTNIFYKKCYVFWKILCTQ